MPRREPPGPDVEPERPESLNDAFAGPARAARRRRILVRAVGAARVLFAAAGVVALVVLVRSAGPAALAASLARAAPWLPPVIAIEVVRVSMDAVATYFALGRRARALPVAVLARAQLIGAAVSAVAPAGRTAAEATKAALIAPWTGMPAATAAAATSQASTLVSTGLASIPCAWAAYALTGGSALTIALVAHAVLLVLGGAGLRALMRARRAGRWLERRSARLGRGAASFQESAREAPIIAPRPTAALLVGRLLQVAQYAILARAAGVDASAVRALFAQGLNLISLATGSLVPGQVGVSEGTFVLSAHALGTTEAKAMTIALLAHVVQVVFVPIGTITPMVWRARKPESTVIAE
ncbi:MAG: flippase-like domain-containing protein [Polyangiaceae bacterium]|nr:flippase-like domain-containing protein [Polyangiaceae bacterium]